MHPVMSDRELLAAAARRLGVGPEALMRRYYGSPEDARLELEELDRNGRLQPSLAKVLRLELGIPRTAAG
jgi:hypothetical protein